MEDIVSALAEESIKRPNVRVYKILALGYRKLGKYDEAIDTLKKAYEKYFILPDEDYEIIGSCYVLKGDFVNAEKWIKKSQNIHFHKVIELYGKDYFYVISLRDHLKIPPIFGGVSKKIHEEAPDVNRGFSGDALDDAEWISNLTALITSGNISSDQIKELSIEFAKRYSSNVS